MSVLSNKQNKLIDADNRKVVTREDGEQGKDEESKGDQIYGVKEDQTLGGENILHYTS